VGRRGRLGKLVGAMDYSIPGLACYKCGAPLQARRLVFQDGVSICTVCAYRHDKKTWEFIQSQPDPLLDGRYAKFGGRTH